MGREVAAQAKPLIVALDFQSDFDGGKMGHHVARIATKHAFLRRIYETIEEIDQDDRVEAKNFHAKFDDDPAKIAQFAKDEFNADIVMWGKIVNPGGDKYELFVKALDLRKPQGQQLVLNTSYDCDGVHAVPEHIQAAILALEGAKPAPQITWEDYVKDESWKKRKNLVKNPGFEEGTGSPADWEKVDGLCSFWVSGQSPTGKCVMFDTDVLQSQQDEWRAKFEAGAPASQAPKKLPTKPPKYDTVGGNKGAHLYSDPIPVKPGMTYRLDFDVRCPNGGTSPVFVKGYGRMTSADFGAQDREIYRSQVFLKAKTDGKEWEHLAMIFRPTQRITVLPFYSPFDQDKTGAEVRQIVQEAAVKAGAYGVVPMEEVDKALSQRKIPLTQKSTAEEMGHFVSETFRHSVTLWGTVHSEAEGADKSVGPFQIVVQSLDVRPEVVNRILENRVYRVEKSKMATTATRQELKNVGMQIMKDLTIKPIVKFLRVKLDTYWPPGKYYFDNIAITEEGIGK
jgi:hypothetical protein